ncbi:MAG TPA: hypothetical protein VGV85_02190 [Longimicrobiaceae bacterium]|nr:hypothetical protein [Longimicrobiaceae bacterium]
MPWIRVPPGGLQRGSGREEEDFDVLKRLTPRRGVVTFQQLVQC